MYMGILHARTDLADLDLKGSVRGSTNLPVPVIRVGCALSAPKVRPFFSEASLSFPVAWVNEHFARAGASTFGMSEPGWSPSCPS